MYNRAMSSKVEVLVVDSSGFIKCTSLESVGKEIITIRDVISEVKDPQTRQRLSVLPFELKFRDPDPEAIRSGETDILLVLWTISSDRVVSIVVLVSEFAKKTGDFASLSAVDVRLLALCRQLAVERSSDKGADLRTEPSTQVMLDFVGTYGEIFLVLKVKRPSLLTGFW